jgi:hypothetical protein
MNWLFPIHILLNFVYFIPMIAILFSRKLRSLYLYLPFKSILCIYTFQIKWRLLHVVQTTICLIFCIWIARMQYTDHHQPYEILSIDFGLESNILCWMKWFPVIEFLLDAELLPCWEIVYIIAAELKLAFWVVKYNSLLTISHWSIN